MRIIDAQVHIWTAGKASPHHQCGRPDPFNLEALEAEMRVAGVDGAVLAPTPWDPSGNAPSLVAATEFSDRYTVTGFIDQTAAPNPQQIRDWCKQPGMSGLRLSFNSRDKQATITGGKVDWIWQAAESADVPIMVLIPGGVPLVGEVAQQYPHLRLCVDHLGIPRGAKDAAAFAHLPELLALAKYPNVVTKIGGMPTYSTVDDFPYPSLHGYLRQVYDAFGPERLFWASDLTRMSCSYSEVVTMFTEGIPWLSTDDKRLIMGESVCRWLGWKPAGIR